MSKQLNHALRLALLGATLEPQLARDCLSALKCRLRDFQSRDPMESVLYTVLVGSALFYASEHGRNPKVQSFYDALIYVSTNLSVGYSDIFAQTPLGKLIGTATMTWGPAMTASFFDPPADCESRTESASDPEAATLASGVRTEAEQEARALARATLERLDAILALLKERR